MFKHLKNVIRQNQGICFKSAFFCLPSSFEKGGKIQTRWNCEYDGLLHALINFEVKGNLIWECPFGVIVSTKKPTIF